MPKFAVEITVMPRASLLDPQGQAVAHALAALEFEDVGQVRIGKAIRFEVERASEAGAVTDVRSMCQKLLANPVTEDFNIEVRELG